jgi:acyl-coenzyme A synthetase/AMP-(fatty) acid ligase
LNVVGPILHFGRVQPDAVALVEGERTITYGELAGLIERTGAHLLALGARPRDKIGLCLGDSADHVVTLLAVAHIGAVAAPLDWRARPAETGRLTDGLGFSRVIAEPHIRLPEACPTIRLDPAWRAAVAKAKGEAAAGTDWHDPFVISATSGSTGEPKLTAMTHTQYYFAVAGMFELMALSGRHRFLCTMPLYYSGGRNSCIAHLLRGDAVVLYPSLFTPAEYVEVVGQREITVGGLVPSVVRQLLAADFAEIALPGLAVLFSTGAPLHAEEKRAAARRLCPNFRERYGTAETLAISILQPKDFADRAQSVGQPHSLATVEIVDDADRQLATGAVGRLRIQGPGLATPLPGAAEASFRDGWFYPGEIARLDEAGYIFLQGRTSDVIMRSGAKIWPSEVEAALLEHPGIVEAAVIGRLGDDGEEVVIAFVAAKEGVGAGEVLAHCRGRLSPHKIPRRIHFRGALPKNTAGKIDKATLMRWSGAIPAREPFHDGLAARDQSHEGEYGQ